jgi:hypothetical protein
VILSNDRISMPGRMLCQHEHEADERRRLDQREQLEQQARGREYRSRKFFASAGCTATPARPLRVNAVTAAEPRLASNVLLLRRQEGTMGRTTNATGPSLGELIVAAFERAEDIAPNHRVAAQLASRSIARLLVRSNRLDCARKLRRS